MKRLHFIALCALAILTACRGGISNRPPVHLVQDMDFQQKIKAQSEFEFENWEDRRGMRMPVEGTVARGTLESAELARYQEAGGGFIANPVKATREHLLRGQERFNIYCAVCHDRAGSGKGPVLRRAGYAFAAVVPDLGQEERLQRGKMPDGQLFQTITKGIGTMPGYAHAISAQDRWCIVHYVRALQNRFIKQ